MSNTPSNKYRVFVYGTLMKGARNEHFMSGAKLISENAVTKEKSFLMLQFNSSSSPGKFSPGVKRGGQGHIQGEIYEVDKEGLDKLDALEQNGVRYQREKIKMQDGSTAWMYVLIAKDQDSKQYDRIDFDPRTEIYSWKREEPKLTR